jgi:hypothetical protein
VYDLLPLADEEPTSSLRNLTLLVEAAGRAFSSSLPNLSLESWWWNNCFPLAISATETRKEKGIRENVAEMRKVEGLRRKADWQIEWQGRVAFGQTLGTNDTWISQTSSPMHEGGAWGRLFLVGLEGQIRRGMTIPRSLLCIYLD